MYSRFSLPTPKTALRAVLRTALLLILSAIAVLSAQGVPKEIVGILRNESGEAIADIGVQLRGWLWPIVETNTVTDSNGAFRFPVTSGYWMVEVSSADLLQRNYRPIASLSINVGSQSVLTQLVAHPIGPTNHLRGRVVDGLGHSLTNWMVSAVASNGAPSLQAITDTTGAFDLALFSGPWTVTLGQTYFFPNLPLNPNWIYPRRSIQMIAGMDQDIQLTAFLPTATISGTARGSDGRNFDLVSIRAVNESLGSKYEKSVSTSPDGSFSLPVFDGVWTLSASIFSPCCSGYGDLSNIVIAVHGTNETVQLISQAPTQFVKGAIVDLHGNPLPGATIFASKLSPDYQTFNAVSDTNGNFAIPTSPGKWTLSMTLQGWIPLERQTFYIAPGEEKTGLVLRAARTTGRIEVEFVGGEELDLELNVSASPTINGQPRTLFSVVDSNRRATFEVSDGVWTIHPTIDGSLSEPPQYVVPPDQVVTVTGNTQQITFALEPYPEQKTHLRGRLLTPDGHPFPSIEVFADAGYDYKPSVLTSADGSFDLEVWEGIWGLHASAAQLRPLNLMCSSPFYFVTNGVDVDGIELPSAVINGVLRGSVVNESGEPLANISFNVSHWTSNSVYGATVVSDEHGEFSTDAFDGDWYVEAVNLNHKGYQSVLKKLVQVTDGLGSVTFTLPPLSPTYWIPQLSLPVITNGGLQLTLKSEIVEHYRIDQSSDLSHWTPIATNFARNGSFQFTDQSITNATHRFYRAIVQP